MECVAFMILREKCCHRGWSVGPPLKLNFFAIYFDHFNAVFEHIGQAQATCRHGPRRLGLPRWPTTVGHAAVGPTAVGDGGWTCNRGHLLGKRRRPAAMAHGGWAYHGGPQRLAFSPVGHAAVGPTVVGDGGWTCNRRGPRRPPWRTTVGGQIR
jgi:hypothetical protein